MSKMKSLLSFTLVIAALCHVNIGYLTSPTCHAQSVVDVTSPIETVATDFEMADGSYGGPESGFKDFEGIV